MNRGKQELHLLLPLETYEALKQLAAGCEMNMTAYISAVILDNYYNARNEGKSA